ncbi:thioredoxin domain-containing protein [Halovenus sp. WSH3]|uniref:Thioredoxin domain-containing protein n=1 Tax=Halovenus carboxidivorans TaxID=2692199 RepID=A0A6B0T464_9EURY|nr:thioredoxin domain-containing protein [Halovenus carboxidivorans]MXR52885.1 thioredoxin domain-containing protein [Halovenus carboxidivorans]
MTPQKLSRRGFVTALTAGAVGALAGCLSNGRDPGEQAPGQPLAVPTKGDPEADITVRAYEDIACPHCATYQTTVVPEIEREYLDPGTVRYEFYDMVLPVDKQVSWEGANAARSVQDHAGEEAFWQYLDALFENQSELGPDTYQELAAELDVDGETVRTDATEQAYDETVSHYTSEAEDNGVNSTPTVVVNGTTVEWGEEIAVQPVAEAIERERQ